MNNPGQPKGEAQLHTTAAVICAVCSHRWTAVVEGLWLGDPALECPECETFAGIVAEDSE